jgi:anaerobic ribonucleoside-triphosphate reductase
MSKKQKCEVYSRVVGYLSPVSKWNEGKKEEFKDRKTFKTTLKDKEKIFNKKI